MRVPRTSASCGAGCAGRLCWRLVRSATFSEPPRLATGNLTSGVHSTRRPSVIPFATGSQGSESRRFAR